MSKIVHRVTDGPPLRASLPLVAELTSPRSFDAAEKHQNKTPDRYVSGENARKLRFLVLTDRPCGRRSRWSPNSHRPVRPMPPQNTKTKTAKQMCPRRECSKAPLSRPDGPPLRASLPLVAELTPPRSSDAATKHQNKNRQTAVFILVSPARIELTAPGLGNLCSIRLSYGDICFLLPVFYLKRNKKTEPCSSVFHYPSKCPKK